MLGGRGEHFISNKFFLNCDSNIKKKCYILFKNKKKIQFFSQRIVFKILCRNNEHDNNTNENPGLNATAIKFKYLAKKMKNNKYLLKDECATGLLNKIYGASPKYVP